MKRKLKGIEIFNIILVAILVICSIAMYGMSIMNKNVSTNIPTAEVKVSKRYDRVNTTDRNTDSEYVTFDAFFLKDLDGDGKADAVRGTCNEVGKSDILYFELRVLDNGYLKDGTITINGQNFFLGTSIVKDEVVKNNYLSTDTKKIALKDVQNGTQKLFMGVVRSGDYSNQYSKTSAIGNDTTKYSRENSITLKGTHVAEDGTETTINKVVPFYVDWYGKTTATIATTNITTRVSDFTSLYDDKNLKLSFNVQTAETSNQLILKNNVLTGKMPDLNGYMPTEVTITGTGLKTSTYNSETGEFYIEKEASINSNGIVTTNAYTTQNYSSRLNTYTFKVTYPLESYDVLANNSITLKIPMQTYYSGYNNPNEAFNNPYVSNIAASTVVVTWYEYLPVGTIPVPRAEVTVGRYIGSPYNRYYISKEKPLKIYNDISDGETNDYYTVSWYAYTGGFEFPTILIKEDAKESHNKIDTFIKTDSSEESTEDVVSTVGIYMSSPVNLVGNDGWIKVYNDDTNELLVTFTKDNWNLYNASNPYMYETPVKRVRVETSAANKYANIYIYHVKEIYDDLITNKYSREEFDRLEHIKTNMKVYFEGYDSVYDRVASAWYMAPWSTASINISPNQISTQETYEHELLKITTKATTFMEQKWKDATFILKMPKDIINMSINNVTVDNSNVRITDTSLYEENGNYYLRLETENNEPTTYTITVDCNITPDPRMATETETIEMYAKNGDGVDYYYRAKDIYDVDTNGNTEENVHKSTVNIDLISPNNLLTHQIGTNYDDKGSVTIAPRIAKVEKKQRKANVEITVTNNYANKITNVLIQGVIPFTGNKFVLGNRDLGSSFTTIMSSTGVQLPAELADYATVYYSTLDRPTNDVSDPTNGWVTAENVVDWSQIKTFIIDLGEYELKVGEGRVFTYEINIPEGVNYNEVSYSEHAVYFDLETEAGLYSTSTAVSKLGFMIAKQYDLVITKYQENTNKKLPSVTYKLTEVGKDNESIKKLTNENGQIVIEGLYAERKYVLQETKISSDYVLNNQEIEFYTYVDENDNLILKYYDEQSNRYEELTNKYDWIKSAQVVKEENQDHEVHIVLEDEVKARLRITKTNGSGETLKGARFALTGEGKNSTLVTNAEGIANATGLYLDKTYTLEEIRAVGYYLIEEPITFKITSTASGFELTVNGQATGYNITTEDEIPTINISIDDEKIPTYSLKVKKYAEHKDGEEVQKLAGAQFKLTGDGLPERGVSLTTDENGELNIEGLYEYVEKNGSAKGNYEAKYTLTEIHAPEGFALDSTPIVFKATRINGELSVQIIEGADRISDLGPATVTNASSDTPVVEFALEDPPIFTLMKYDEEGNPLAGAKFSIFELNDNLTVKGYAKDLSGNYIGDFNETNNSYTITTPEDGKISLNLPQGLYKAIEVEAPEGYILPENAEERTEYFGVGASKAEEAELKLMWKNPIKGEGFNTINSIYATKGGGTISVGSVYGSTILSEDGQKTITSLGRKDGLIIKQDADGGIEWVKNIGGALGEEFRKVIQTRDDGYAVVGYFESEEMNIDTNITNSGARDAILIKLSPSGEYEWSTVIGGTLEDYAYSLCEDSSGNILVSGGYFSNTLSFSGTTDTLTNLGDMDGYVVSFSSTGAFNWAQNLGSTNATSGVQAVDVEVINDNYVVAVNFWGTLQVGLSLATPGAQESALVFYNSTGDCIKAISISGAGYDDVRGVTLDNDGNMVVYGNRTNSTTIKVAGDDEAMATVESIGGTTYLSSYVFRFDNDGLYLPDQSFIFGNSAGNDEIMEVVPTENYGLLIAGFTYSSTLDIDNDGTNDMISTGDTNTSYSRGFVAKIDENNKVTSVFRQYYAGTYQETRTVAETEDKGMVAGGVVDGTTLNFDPNGATLTGFDAYSEDGFIVKYGNLITSPEVPEKTELVVNNKLQRFKVTTTEYSIENVREKTTQAEIDAEEEERLSAIATGNYTRYYEVKYPEIERLYDIGGTVTGDYGTVGNENYPQTNHIRYVETIIYNENGQREIVITPETDYSIVGILINGEPYKYSTSETDGSVTIPVFENVTEDKHIDVIVDKNMSEIRVNHYLWTETDGKTITKVAESESYFGKVGEDYTTSPRTDIDYEIVTNKDIYGNITEEEVPVKTGKTLAELGYTEITDPEDENYGKTPLEQFLNDNYIPTNANDKFKSEVEIINYYYKAKEYTLTVRHFIEGTETRVPNKNTGEPIEDTVTEKLKATTPYITTKSDEVDYSIYELVSVGTTDENATINDESLETTGQITADTVVTYYYRVKDGAEVIVHHYIVGTEIKVPSNTGGQVEDEIINTVKEDEVERPAKVGDRYTTNYAENIALGYRIAKNSDVYEGKTEQQVLEEIGKNSWSETRFASFEEFLEANYLPSNYEGRFASVTQEVTYYYIIETPKLVNAITKDVDKEVIKETDEDKSLTYTMVYNTTINDYIGDASVTIKDTLPFEIDTDKPYSLNGGYYDAETRTITWRHAFSVNTYTDITSGVISIPKTITLTYKNIAPLTTTLVNTVEGTTNLIDANIMTDPAIDTAVTTLIQDRTISVVKVWEDNNNNLSIRPRAINVNLIGNVEGQASNVNLKAIDSTIETTVELSSSTNWKHTWNNLPKYDNDGKEITYTVQEEALEGNLAVVYSAVVTGDMASGYIITNTYTIPTQKISLVVNKVWDDNNNEHNKRPAQIKFEVYTGASTKVAEYVLNTATEASHTFELDKYDAKGNILEYTVKEVEVNVGDLIHYETPQITNGATVNDIIITNKIKELTPQETSTITKTGTDTIYKVDDVVNYVINYKAEVKDYLGNATLEIIDELPYHIDEAQSDLKEGIYNETAKTITWTYDLGEIDTITNGDYEIEKNISIDVVFTDIDTSKTSMINNVKGILTLDNIVDEVEDDTPTEINAKSGVIVHHYIENTVIQLAPDDKIQDRPIGEEYTTQKSPAVPKNYEVVSVVTEDEDAIKNEETLQTTGHIKENLIVVIYYYNLKEETITNEIVKKARATKQVEVTNEETGVTETHEVLTKEDGVVTYNIKYNYTIKDYIGKAKVTVTDTLPAKINVERSNLQGGTYNEATNTITWEEMVENINTYECEEEMYKGKVEKQITVVFDGQDVNAVLDNTVKGTTVTYYPSTDPTKPGEEKARVEAEDNAPIYQEYKTERNVIKVWDDNNNERGNRPEKVEAVLKVNDEIIETALLSKDNSWEHKFANLKKYDEEGSLIEYSITEREISQDDLEYYEEAVIEENNNTTTITNKYRKLSNKIDSKIVKDGTKELIGKQTEVQYNIKYNATITQYIGEAKATLIDYLPYKIDVNKSDLAGGEYDEDAKTITWVQDLGHINTVKDDDFKVEITKQIKVNYIDIDTKAEKMTNKVKGKIELIPTGEKDEVEADHDTILHILGKIIVKYKDIDTDMDKTTQQRRRIFHIMNL